MKRADKPAERHTVIERLQTIPSLVCRRHIDECQHHSGDKLEYKDRESSAAEDVCPARGFARNRMPCRFFYDARELQPIVEPAADSFDQAHGGFLSLVLARKPGVGNSPACTRSSPPSTL